jgi:hypothetical protein
MGLNVMQFLTFIIIQHSENIPYISFYQTFCNFSTNPVFDQTIAFCKRSKAIYFAFKDIFFIFYAFDKKREFRRQL